MLKGVVVGFMVDGMCKISLGIILKLMMAILGLHGQVDKTQEALEKGNPADIAVSFVELICMVFGLTSQCFTGDTLVSTEYGLVPIEEIEIGDYIWSEDTEKHPFYVEGKGWVAAAELEAGDILHIQGGQEETVANVTVDKQKELVKVYNLTIEDYHTYYVSEESVLVHNICSAQEMNKKKQEVLEGKDTSFKTLDDLLLFIQKKFPELLEEQAGHRSAEGWHFDEHFIEQYNKILKHINIYSKKYGFRVHLFWED